MIKHNLKSSWRNLWNNKFFSLLNILGLSVGMATTVLVLLWVFDELSYDRFHENLDQLYGVIKKTNYSDGSNTYFYQTPFGLKQDLENNYPEVIEAVRIPSAMRFTISHGEKSFSQESIGFVDPSFLSMFSFNIISGDKDALENPDLIVISEDIAKIYFDNEDPIGKVLKLDNRLSFTVGAVMENIPKNSTFQFNILIPFTTVVTLYGIENNDWGTNWPRTIIQVKEGISITELENKITELYVKHEYEDVTISLKPFSKEHLYTDSGINNYIQYIYLFISIGLIIIIIASINFVNLSTAKTEKRSVEVGIRKVNGAGKRSLVYQFFSEKLLLVLFSLVLAIVLAKILTPLFNDISGKQIEFSFFRNKYFLLLFLVTTLITTVLTGIYPALFLSSFSPLKALKSMVGTGGKNKISLRNILIILQFSMSILLIIGTLVIALQLNFIKNHNLGYKSENLVYINMSGEGYQRPQPFINKLEKLPEIVGLTKASQIPFYWNQSTNSFQWEGKDTDNDVNIKYMQVDRKYFDVMGINFKDGSTFSDFFDQKLENPDRLDVVLNEEAILRMKLENPIGKFFRNNESDGKIVGVIKDFNYETLKNSVDPLALIPLLGNPSVVIARINTESIQSTMDAIQTSWEEINPETPFSFGFFDDRLEQMYRLEMRISSLFRYFAFIAIFIACLGLLGLSLYATERRIKEIGLRKVNGAKISEILSLLNKDFIKWVAIAFVVACPLAYYAMNKWLENFAYKTNLSWWIFALAGVLALGIALLTVSWQSWKAATRNPVEALRYE